MTEAIAFPDVEAFSVSYLKAQKPDLSVSTIVPNPRPPSFVRVSRTGGTQRDLVTDSPQVLVECFAPSTLLAAALAIECRAYMQAAARRSDAVTRVQDVGGVVSLADPGTNLPRYQFVVQLDMRGTAL